MNNNNAAFDGLCVGLLINCLLERIFDVHIVSNTTAVIIGGLIGLIVSCLPKM